MRRCEECGGELPAFRGGVRKRCGKPACERASVVRRTRIALAAKHGVPPGCCVVCRVALEQRADQVLLRCSGCSRKNAPKRRPSADRSLDARGGTECRTCGRLIPRSTGRGQQQRHWCDDACWSAQNGRAARRLDETADAHPGVIELREARAAVAVALLSLRQALDEHLHGAAPSAPQERADAWAGYVSPAGWES